MSKFPELSNDEIFDVLMCGGKPRGYGYTIQDYVDEWNDRVNDGKWVDREEDTGEEE